MGSFSITQLGFKPDKIGKDDNFRGLTIFNNVLYFSKGSGGNGVNTVYFVDTTGQRVPHPIGGSRRRRPAAKWRDSAHITDSSYNPAILQTSGLPNNMCILTRLPCDAQQQNQTSRVTAFPFGLWFANATTLYVADEGDGVFANAATQTTAGLQKWIFDSGREKLEARLRL